jgi:hypothetical protein
MPRLLVVLDTRSLECGCGFVEGEQMLFCPDHREGYPMPDPKDEEPTQSMRVYFGGNESEIRPVHHVDTRTGQSVPELKSGEEAYFTLDGKCLVVRAG